MSAKRPHALNGVGQGGRERRRPQPDLSMSQVYKCGLFSALQCTQRYCFEETIVTPPIQIFENDLISKPPSSMPMSPQYMVEDPSTGSFKYWIFVQIILCHFKFSSEFPLINVLVDPSLDFSNIVSTLFLLRMG